MSLMVPVSESAVNATNAVNATLSAAQSKNTPEASPLDVAWPLATDAGLKIRPIMPGGKDALLRDNAGSDDRDLADLATAGILSANGRMKRDGKRPTANADNLNWAVDSGSARSGVALMLGDSDSPGEDDVFESAGSAWGLDLAGRPFTVKSPGSWRRDKKTRQPILDVDGQPTWVHKGRGHVWIIATAEDVEPLRAAAESRGVNPPTQLYVNADGSFSVSGTEGNGRPVVKIDTKYCVAPGARREEGTYQVSGPAHTATAAMLYAMYEAIVKYADAVVASRTEREKQEAALAAKRQAAIDAGEQPQLTIDEAALEMDALQVLLDNGWEDLGRSGCECTDLSAPGPHSSTKTAVLHRPGCTYRENVKAGRTKLRYWSDDVTEPEMLAVMAARKKGHGGKEFSDVDIITAYNHGGSYNAMKAHYGVVDDAPAVSRYAITDEERNDMLAINYPAPSVETPPESPAMAPLAAAQPLPAPQAPLTPFNAAEAIHEYEDYMANAPRRDIDSALEADAAATDYLIAEAEAIIAGATIDYIAEDVATLSMTAAQAAPEVRLATSPVTPMRLTRPQKEAVKQVLSLFDVDGDPDVDQEAAGRDAEVILSGADWDVEQVRVGIRDVGQKAMSAVASRIRAARATESATTINVSGGLSIATWVPQDTEDDVQASVDSTSQMPVYGDIIYGRDVHIIGGRRGTGKTWLALHLALMAARATADDPNVGPVLITDLDNNGKSATQRRLRALGATRREVATLFNIFSVREMQAESGHSAATITKSILRAATDRTKPAPAMTIIDTTTSYLSAMSLDSNSDVDVQRGLELIDPVATRCPVLMLDHTGRAAEASRRMSGSAAKENAVTVVIVLDKLKDDDDKAIERPDQMIATSMRLTKDRHAGITKVSCDEKDKEALGVFAVENTADALPDGWGDSKNYQAMRGVVITTQSMKEKDESFDPAEMVADHAADLAAIAETTGIDGMAVGEFDRRAREVVGRTRSAEIAAIRRVAVAQKIIEQREMGFRGLTGIFPVAQSAPEKPAEAPKVDAEAPQAVGFAPEPEKPAAAPQSTEHEIAVTALAESVRTRPAAVKALQSAAKKAGKPMSRDEARAALTAAEKDGVVSVEKDGNAAMFRAVV